MADKYYIDTSIWRDFYENRSDKLRPLGEWAYQLFVKITKEKEEVLYSELVIKEMSIEYTLAKIEEIFRIIHDKGLLHKVEISDEQIIEAHKLSRQLGIPSNDCLHAILARDNDAIMVTRDAHFIKLSDIVEVKKPEELI